MPNDVSIPGDVIREIEAPARRPAGRQWPLDLDKTEARIELADHIVLRRRDVISDQLPHAALPRRLDRDVHRLEFELSAEHAAAHHPILDLEHVFVIGRGAEDHGTDETVVAHAIEEAKL